MTTFMADKMDPVVELVEEEEEEWPEAGAQNVEEAEWVPGQNQQHLRSFVSFNPSRTQKQLFCKPYRTSRRLSPNSGTSWGQLIQK